MSIYSTAGLDIDNLKNLDDVRDYLVQQDKKVRFLSLTVDGDNFASTEDYQYFYSNQTKAAQLSVNLDAFKLTFSDAERDIYAKIIQQMDEIDLRVSKGEVTHYINISTDKIVIGGEKLIVQSENFTIDTDGNLSMQGTIDALAGNFGDFSIVNENGASYLAGVSGSRIDTADLNGTNINCRTLNITTDRDIEGCDVAMENCRVVTSLKTYFGWFYCGDVDVSGTVRCNAAFIDNVVDVSGTVYCYDIWSDEAGIAYSDRRLKEDVQEIDGKKALDFLMKLRPVAYMMKDDASPCYGLIAQEVLAAGDPYGIVHTDSESGYYSIEYGALDAVIAAAMQEQEREMRDVGI